MVKVSAVVALLALGMVFFAGGCTVLTPLDPGAIVGMISDSSGAPLGAVSVHVSGSEIEDFSVVSDASGRYVIENVVGTVTVTPSKSNVAFVPEQMEVTEGGYFYNFVGAFQGLSVQPAAGIYTSETINLSMQYTSGYQLYYTIDGSDPGDADSTRTLYTGPVTLAESESYDWHVRAAAIHPQTGAVAASADLEYAIYNAYWDFVDGYPSGWPAEERDRVVVQDGVVSIRSDLGAAWFMNNIWGVRGAPNLAGFNYSVRFRLQSSNGTAFLRTQGPLDGVPSTVVSLNISPDRLWVSAAGDAVLEIENAGLVLDQWYDLSYVYRDGEIKIILDGNEVSAPLPDYEPQWYYFGRNGNMAWDVDLIWFRAYGYR